MLFPIVATALAIDLLFFSSNFVKIAHGGWFPLALGLVMVYSASIAMPDNPRFGNLQPFYILQRHAMAIVIAFVAVLLVGGLLTRLLGRMLALRELSDDEGAAQAEQKYLYHRRPVELDQELRQRFRAREPALAQEDALAHTHVLSPTR